MQLLCAYFTKVRERVARKGNRKLFRIKLEILKAMINAPILKPMMKKERTPTCPMYSGSRNKNGMPNLDAIVSVMKPNSSSQYSIII
jgi:hypothetical protein